MTHTVLGSLDVVVPDLGEVGGARVSLSGSRWLGRFGTGLVLYLSTHPTLSTLLVGIWKPLEKMSK